MSTINENKIPLELPKDSLREGFVAANRLISKQQPTHPLYKSLIQQEQFEKQRQYYALSHVFGQAMPMHLEMEKFIVQTPLRLPTLQSSKLAMDTLTGRDETIDFEDYLQDENMSEEGGVVGNSRMDLHSQMEKRLNLDVNIRF
jgi:proteasome maturation protein